MAARRSQISIFPNKRVATEGHPYSNLRGRNTIWAPQADVAAVGTRVYFLNHTTEGRIDHRGIVDAVVDLHCVMVHLGAALGANQFIHDSDFQSVSENICANSRAMLRS